VNSQRHSAADATTAGWDSRCAAVVRIGPVPRGWRSDTGGTWRYLKVEKANFQLNYCHGGTVLYCTVFRIRIHIFLGLPDPDPLVRGMNPDPAPDPSIILLSSSENSNKNLVL
jgi:hypothetical protein